MQTEAAVIKKSGIGEFLINRSKDWSKRRRGAHYPVAAEIALALSNEIYGVIATPRVLQLIEKNVLARAVVATSKNPDEIKAATITVQATDIAIKFLIC